MDEAFAHINGGNKTCKKGLVPPDGGWGYLVAVGVGFTFVSFFLFSIFIFICCNTIFYRVIFF